MSVKYCEYAFTVKGSSRARPAEHEDYVKWVDNAREQGFNVMDWIFERDQKERLHIHGIASAPTNFYKKRVMFNAFHQKIDKLPTQMDASKWFRYMMKDQHVLVKQEFGFVYVGDPLYD